MSNNVQAPEYLAAADHAQRHLGHAKGECRFCKGTGWSRCLRQTTYSFGCEGDSPCPDGARIDEFNCCSVPCPNCDGGER